MGRLDVTCIMAVRFVCLGAHVAAARMQIVQQFDTYTRRRYRMRWREVSMFAAERRAVGLHAAGLALLLLLLPVVPSMAQTWPQRPVKFVVTLGPGSGVDFGTRLLGDRLSKRWGQPVVIENRPGGDAIVAVTAVISANDDHVLLASPTSALTAHPYMLQQM